MLQPHVTPLPLALVAAVHAACLFALVAVFRAPSPQFPGWRVVRPGVMPWVVFIGSWAFAMMVTWAWLFVGSSLSDAEEQMRSALFLTLALGTIAAASGFHIIKLCRRELRWRGPVVSLTASGNCQL